MRLLELELGTGSGHAIHLIEQNKLAWNAGY
jgi:hypothetical protein